MVQYVCRIACLVLTGFLLMQLTSFTPQWLIQAINPTMAALPLLPPLPWAEACHGGGMNRIVPALTLSAYLWLHRHGCSAWVQRRWTTKWNLPDWFSYAPFYILYCAYFVYYLLCYVYRDFSPYLAHFTFFDLLGLPLLSKRGGLVCGASVPLCSVYIYMNYTGDVGTHL